MTGRATGRTIVITGGTRGIGDSLTRAFCEQGDFVLIGARTDTGLARRLGSRVRFRKTDVRKESDHRMLAKAARVWTGRLDVYINCAGFSGWRPVGEVTEKFWNEMLDTNLKGTFWGCKAASEHLRDGGCILNISSLAGKRGSARNSVYCASKFGVTGLTQSLAKELGPRGIRVNAVCPVYVETEGLEEALSDRRSPARGKPVREYLKKFALENAALERLPTGTEVSRVCLFLVSAAASAVTGQSVNVDCGVLPQ